MNDRSKDLPCAPVLLRHFDEGIVTLTLNRPRQFNSLSSAVLGALHAELDAVASDEAIRVVILTGSGAAFCAGHDLKEMSAMGSQQEVESLFSRCSDLMLKLVALPQPVIAAVNGLATAAGCQLVAQCDLAVASEHARFAVSGINLGLFCSTPAVALSRSVSRKRAAEMLFTGEFIEASTALDWGLVNRIAPAERLMETTRALANNLKAKPRAELARGKALFYRQLEAGLESAYRDATRNIAGSMASADAREGVEAFLAKRPPRWTS